MDDSVTWRKEITRRSAVLAMHTSCYGLNKYTPYLFGVPFLYQNVLYVNAALYKDDRDDQLLKRLLREAFEADHHYFLSIASRIRGDGAHLSAFCLNFLDEPSVRNTPEKNLPQLFCAYIDLMAHFGVYYRFMEPGSFVIESVILETLQSRFTDPLAVQQAFLVLAVTREHEYGVAENRSRLRVAAEANRRLGHQARSLPRPHFVEALLADPVLLEALSEHTRRFSWMGAPGHLGKQHTVREYAEFVADLGSEDPAGQLTHLEEEDRLRLARAEQLMTELRINDRERKIVESLQEYNYLTGFVKEIVLSSRQRADNLLTRIARILDLKWEHLMMLTFEEILAALHSGKVADTNLNNLAATRVTSWGMRITTFTAAVYGGADTAILESELESIPQGEKGEVTGVVANPGQTRAPAKVIRSRQDLAKIERGDIIVTPMTTVEYNAALDKVAGIITDEGGMTSHAATIAREKRIPCLVGTGSATSVFRDSDLVELDAIRGKARRLGA